MKSSATFRVLLSVLFLAVFHLAAHAQLTITTPNPNNAQAYVDILVDQTITTSNTSWYGSSAQFGFFTGGILPIGIDSGIAMSSGLASGMASGGVGFNSSAVPAGANQGGGDGDLLSVAASVPGLIGATFTVNSTWNAAILEFDFISVSDTIEFNYVFTSEEWPVWTCTTFNDVFGFFVSGPGITGTYSSPLGFPNGSINVATVPGTNPPLPVTISTIHNGTGGGVPNCANAFNNQYYIVGNNTNYNARTTVLTAKFPTIACNNYHMKLAIADGSDQIYDSGVYLEANSFTGSGITVLATPSYTAPGNLGADTALYEGCGQINLTFIRTLDSLALADTIALHVQGNASPGIDYTALPPSIIFAANQDTASLTFSVFHDNLVEGIEYLTLIVDSTSTASCSNDCTVINFSLHDVPLPQLILTPDTTINCTDDSVFIVAQVDSGLAPYTFQWNNLNPDSTFNTLPSATTTYDVTVTDACGVEQVFGSSTVTVSTPPWGVQKVNDQTVINCTSAPVDLGVNITGPFYDGFIYTWLNENNDTISSDSTVAVLPLESTQYTAIIQHPCAAPLTAIRVFDVIVQNDPVILTTQNVHADFILCPGDTVAIKVDVDGGYPGYTVWWETGGNETTELVGPQVTDTFTVWATDTCGLDTMSAEVIVFVPVPPPLEILNIETDSINCVDDIIYLGSTVAGRGGTDISENYIFSWNNFQDSNTIKKVVVTETSSHTIQMTDVCHYDTTSLTIDLLLREHGPLNLSLPEDFHLCPGQTTVLTADATEGGGKYVYTWFPDLGNERTLEISPDVTTSYRVRVLDDCDTFRIGTVNVFVKEIEADFDFNYVTDYEVEFTNRSRGHIDNHLWVFGDGQISDDKHPTHSYENGEEYGGALIVSNEFGCADTAYNKVAPSLWVWIPNTFSPNGDGLNDVFLIEGLAFHNYELSIFDRWGNQIYFENQDSKSGWDGSYKGERAQMGAYIYNVTIIGDDSKIYKKTGTITLINDLRER